MMDTKDQALLNWRVVTFRRLAESEGLLLPAPIKLDIKSMIPTELPKFEWFNHNSHSTVIRLTNTGTTAMLSLKWGDVPYIRGGPLMDHYICCQIHFHWDSHGNHHSFHSFDDCQCPVEMHMIHYKGEYGSFDAALQNNDGIAVVVVFFQVTDEANPTLEFLVNRLRDVKVEGTSTLLAPETFEFLIPAMFVGDYFMYYGSVKTSDGDRPYLWLLSRRPVAISQNQANKFRHLRSKNGEPVVSNSLPLNYEVRHVYHVNPSWMISSTMCPVFVECCPKLHFEGPSYFRSFWKGNTLKHMVSNLQQIIVDEESPEQSYHSSYFKKFLIPTNQEKNFAQWPLTLPQWPNDERMKAPIKFDSMIVEPNFFQPLVYHNYWQDCGSVQMENTGATVALRPLFHRTPSLYGGPLVDVYELDNIHFHWADYGIQTGHVINDIGYSMEIHCVHYLKRHWCLQNAAREKFGIAVVSFYVNIGREFNQDIDPLVNSLKFIRCAFTRKTLRGNMLDWLRSHAAPYCYFAYMGYADCCPPCRKPIMWIMYPRPVQINSRQFEEFGTLRGYEEGWMDNRQKPTRTSDRLIIFSLDPNL